MDWSERSQEVTDLKQELHGDSAIPQEDPLGMIRTCFATPKDEIMKDEMKDELKEELKDEMKDEIKDEVKDEVKDEMKDEEDSESSSEDETGRWVAALRPPQPKKMPRPVSSAEVATPKWSPVPAAPSKNRNRSTSPRKLIRPSSKAAPRTPTGPSARPPLPPPEKRLSVHETSTGLRPQPPPMSLYQESQRSPLPGPPPVQDPPSAGSAVTTLARVAPQQGSMVPWAPPGESQILVDVDQEGLAIGEMLQDSGFIQAMQVIQGRLSDVLKATGQSNGPVRVNVHVDLGGGPPGAPMGILNPCLLNNLQPALQDSGPGGGWDHLAKERIVDASEIRFCQRSMKRRFQDGRSLEELIRSLMAGRIDPLEAGFLKLTVVEKKDENKRLALFSKDNRRLYCLKEYQKRINFQPVPVRVKVLPWLTVMEACMFRRNYDTETDGHQILLRN